MASALTLALAACGGDTFADDRHGPPDAGRTLDAGRAQDASAPDASRPEDEVLRVPVVVHVLHRGEPLGTGFNLSDDRVLGQIDLVNDDLRRRGRGANDDPRGADTRIELVLARRTPDGAPTDGIDRVDVTAVDNPVDPSRRFDHAAHYGYWDHRRYLNVWSEPLPEASRDLFLGEATGPSITLPGSHLLLAGEPTQSEGVLINAWHFGETEDSADHGLGRTLTHELGHYLGLLHLWGAGDCGDNDFLDDTPPVMGPANACPSPPPAACDGTPALVTNYMDFTPDACMNLFTQDQAARMRFVLRNSPERTTLLDSPGL